MLLVGGLAVPIRSGLRVVCVFPALSYPYGVSLLPCYFCARLTTTASDGVESFVVDAVQSRVFTLHTKGEIRYSEAQPNGWLERGACSPGTISNAFKTAGLTPTKIISIAAIGAQDSRRYCLMAITENGKSQQFRLG
jgi:hypothetical protein